MKETLDFAMNFSVSKVEISFFMLIFLCTGIIQAVSKSEQIKRIAESIYKKKEFSIFIFSFLILFI